MSLASRLPIEIISVDSAQVYRGMDIGTAKPSAEEQLAVRHHLIDILDPVDAYSAARFATDARQLIQEIHAREHIPLLVGGTMLYVKALIDGLNDLPPADPGIRAELDTEAARDGWPQLHARLAELDPVTAARLKPTDSQRIQRALEVTRITGQPMSALLASQRAVDDGNQYQCVALEPSDRAVLHQRIASRFTQMMAQGLEQEVRQLFARSDLHIGLPSVRCVGYRQLWQWLSDGADTGTRDAAVQSAIAATRQLAKRQLTWLRSMPTRDAIDCIANDAVTRATDHVARLLDPPAGR